MADPTTPEKPKGASTGPGNAESPTTAQPIDMDDDEQELGVISNDGTSTPSANPMQPPRTSSTPQQQNLTVGQAEEEAPPPKPPRPLSPNQQAESTLIEAFPDTDPKVVKAVLMASGGQLEPAFNALLGMSDPNFKEEEPPSRPPRPEPQRSQMEQDEMLARQMMEHEKTVAQRAQQRRAQQEERARTKGPLEDTDSENDFNIEEDLAQFRENIKQGFNTTQTKVNKWISDFRKRIDGEDPDEQQHDEFGRPMHRPTSSSHSAQQQQSTFPRPNINPASREGTSKGGGSFASTLRPGGRRSTDKDYDADPRVISDNFEELELRDEESEQLEKPPSKPTRPTPNPNLFKPTPNPPSTSPAPVPPQSGPVDEVDALERSQASKDSTAGTGSATKSKKWQPLTSVAPAPEGEDENDPFSLGDDDDDNNAAKEERKVSETVREGDAERLRTMASESGGTPGSPEKHKAGAGAGAGTEVKTLKASERSGSVGTRDKDAEEILKGGSGV